jgi:hypothetical protein
MANITDGPGIAMITRENAMNGNRFWTGTTVPVYGGHKMLKWNLLDIEFSSRVARACSAG